MTTLPVLRYGSVHRKGGLKILSPPAILMIHQHSGLTGYLKTAAYKFAQLGYTAVVPNLYHMLGYPAETHIDKGTEIQNRRPIRILSGLSTAAGAIVFRAAMSTARAFVAYYPSVRDEQPTKIRPRHPCDAAREIQCPSMILYGGHDQHSTFPVQQRVMESFHSNGQSLEWHYFHFGYHGFASTESDGYNPYLADLTWPLVTEFLGRELIRPAL